MSNKNDSFNFLPWVIGSIAIVAILLIIRNTDTPSDNVDSEELEIDKTENSINVESDSLSVEAAEESVASVAFLRLEEEQIDSLPKEMAELYREIIGTQNFASGISIFPVMNSLNKLIDQEFQTHQIDPVENEDELFKSMEGLKVNPRVTAQHLNKGGRIILNKLYKLQDKAYPKLRNQLREVKSALGELPPSGSLQGYGFKVKEFFDESFVFFYLAWENEKEMAEK